MLFFLIEKEVAQKKDEKYCLMRAFSETHVVSPCWGSGGAEWLALITRTGEDTAWSQGPDGLPLSIPTHQRQVCSVLKDPSALGEGCLAGEAEKIPLHSSWHFSLFLPCCCLFPGEEEAEGRCAQPGTSRAWGSNHSPGRECTIRSAHRTCGWTHGPRFRPADRKLRWPGL